jgi:hypothetical protein
LLSVAKISAFTHPKNPKAKSLLISFESHFIRITFGFPNYDKDMKKFILTLAVALFGFAAHAQEQPADGAKIQFAEKVINYGKIDKGANGTRVFKFKNEGNQPLVLNTVRASCGCTTPKWTREPIAPGQEGEITVKYDTNRMGNFHKTVTVNSNATNKTVVLTIKGQVMNPAAQQTTPTKKEGGSIIAK